MPQKLTYPVMELEQCSDFHRVLAKPVPIKLHFTSVGLALLLGTAIVWAIWTQANVVVRGAGRMRPVANELGLEAVSEEISSEVAGRVKSVYVTENQPVSRGQVLVEIHTQQLDHQIKTIEAELSAEQHALKQLDVRHALLENEFAAAIERTQAEIEEARVQHERETERRSSKLAAAEAELAFEQEKLSRLMLLHRSNAITPQELSESQMAVAKAEQALQEIRLAVDENRLDVLRKTLTALEESNKTKIHESETAQAEKRAAIRRKELELAGLKRDRLRSQIVSPVDGIVTTCRVSAGDVVQAGPVGMTVQPNRDLEMVMVVSAADVGQLRLGMPVRIKMDAFDHQTYGTLAGTLRFISPDSTVDTESPQKAATYALRVQIPNPSLERDGVEVQMKLGMTGIAEVVIERDSLLSLLLKKVRHVISL